MLRTTAEFFDIFARHGFLVDASFQAAAGGAPVSIKVAWVAPGDYVLTDDIATVRRAVAYPTASLPGVLPGDSFTVDGQTWRVREVMPKTSGDGSETLAMLVP